ncbi:exo-alpha-sialidase [Kribbella qitaiheensis]|uniref:exo-alpha-sialidase n=1 Tax=Kribbella qitaiheensis TaxID=1544730 RepID=A0A7G6WY00_9ACTN|nr:sialidase family protein [Kribbella qitaiheensis]QNE18865.1 exo-alpha-sialidase [Kribbella qitaiheensis]
MSSRVGPPEVVFDPAGSGYHTFRIPAVVARGEWVFAFCEGRLRSAADAGEIEVVLRRSRDGGRTWLPLQVVSAAAGKTCGNPVPVIDPLSGDLVLVTTQNGADAIEISVARGTDPESGRRVYVQRSTDDGASWSEPAEITAQVKPGEWGWYATGPCHGIALSQGPYAGRLVVPANHSFVPGDVDYLDSAATVRLNGGHCIFSDDGGRTWTLGFVDRNDGAEINPNETAVMELADGRLYFNARNHRGTGPARVHAYSSDGGATLDSQYEGIAEITAPGSQGSVLRVGDRLLLSTPVHPEIRRELTVYVSSDDGRSWRPGVVVHPGMAGYSDLVPLPGGQVGLFYEAGETSSFATLRFVTFDPSTLFGEIS